MSNTLDRRRFLLGMCAGGLATLSAPVFSFATVPGRQRLVFVLLRGAMDGLASIVPVGDPNYARIRGNMALAPGDLKALGKTFGLAPGLSPLHSFWQKGEMLALHAMAIPYRTRSHFDAQAILETGLSKPSATADGWLNRLLQVMDGERAGIAIAAGMPRSLQGNYPVTTWSPSRLGVTSDDYLDRLHFLYREDRLLSDRFEAALQLDELSGDSMQADRPGNGNSRGPNNRGSGAGVNRIMQAAAKILKEDGGPNVAALEISGWDTHAGQGGKGGQLDRRLEGLAGGLITLEKELGELWQNTTVVVMTEFGRTAAPNGSGGTDHGTAGAGFVLGARVSKSAVVTDWPGLASRDLFEGRDLRQTLDTRAVLKAVIASTFELTTAQTNKVFPDSSAVRPLYDLMA